MAKIEPVVLRGPEGDVSTFSSPKDFVGAQFETLEEAEAFFAAGGTSAQAMERTPGFKLAAPVPARTTTGSALSATEVAKTFGVSETQAQQFLDAFSGGKTSSPASSATATDTLASLGLDLPKPPTTQQLLDQALDSPEFKLASDRINAAALGATTETEAQKQGLRKQAEDSTQNFIDTMGRKGLYFSGATKEGIQGIADSLAESVLGADRKLAQQLLESDFDLREQVFRMVEKVADDAQAGRKEALDALEKVGLTVIGDQVVPTLAGRAQTRLEEQATIKNELDAAKFELTQARTIAQLENAQIRLELAEERALRAASALTAADKKSQSALLLYDAPITDALLNGGSPQEALNQAIQAAAQSGVILGVEEQAAVLDYATQLQVALKGVQTQSEQANFQSQFLNSSSGIQNSFTASLFGTAASTPSSR